MNPLTNRPGVVVSCLVLALLAAGCRVPVSTDSVAVPERPTAVSQVEPTAVPEPTAATEPTSTVVQVPPTAVTEPTPTVVQVTPTAVTEPTSTVVQVTPTAVPEPTPTVVPVTPAVTEPTSTAVAQPEPTVVPEIFPGAVWVLTYISPNTENRITYRVMFERDGTFAYDEPADLDHSNESWTVLHSSLTLCINDCFSQYVGLWQDGAFRGTASNVNGATWDFVLTPDLG